MSDVTVILFGAGGYDAALPDGNVVSVEEVPADPAPPDLAATVASLDATVAILAAELLEG